MARRFAALANSAHAMVVDDDDDYDDVHDDDHDDDDDDNDNDHDYVFTLPHLPKI